MFGIAKRYHWVMAMTLRLTEDDARRLRAQALKEGTSMQEVALSAVRSRIANAEDDELDAIITDMLGTYGGAFRRLAEL